MLQNLKNMKSNCNVYGYIFAAKVVIGARDRNAKLLKLVSWMFIFPQRTRKGQHGTGYCLRKASK